MTTAIVEQLALPDPDERNGPVPVEGPDADQQYLRRPTPPGAASSQQVLDIVDLFAGCGGLTFGAIEGARRMGRRARLALAVDQDPAPLAVMRETLAEEPERLRSADLGRTLARVGARETKAELALFGDAAAPRLLLAGPPCQGHSALNNHTRHDDPRNDLYGRVARAAQLLQPAVVIIENVRGVASDRRGVVDTCSRQLEKLGYAVTSRRLNLFELGAPQRRVRHLLVATRRGDFRWLLPVPHRRTVRWAIEDLLAVEGQSAFDTPSSVSSANRERIAWLLRNDAYDLPNAMRPVCHQSDHTYLSMYGRLRWDAPAQTVTSGFGSMGQGRYVHPSRPRTLTPHEAARLQFMPDFMRFDSVTKRGALATMIGNAAPPALTIALVQALLEQKLL